jgi:hypothetical protein
MAHLETPPLPDETRYVSPDGTLTFLILRYSNDVALGFAGTPWHIHGDMLAELSGCSVEEAIDRFLHDLQQGRLVIAVATVSGAVRDIWIKDDAEEPDRYKPEDEVIQLRYWDGTPFVPGRAHRQWNL